MLHNVATLQIVVDDLGGAQVYVCGIAEDVGADLREQVQAGRDLLADLLEADTTGAVYDYRMAKYQERVRRGKRPCPVFVPPLTDDKDKGVRRELANTPEARAAAMVRLAEYNKARG